MICLKLYRITTNGLTFRARCFRKGSIDHGCHIGREVLGWTVSGRFGQMGAPVVWGVKKSQGVKKRGGRAYFWGDINYYIN